VKVELRGSCEQAIQQEEPQARAEPDEEPLWRTDAAAPDQINPNTGGNTTTTIAAHMA
jgi:hypothetical protein